MHPSGNIPQEIASWQSYKAQLRQVLGMATAANTMMMLCAVRRDSSVLKPNLHLLLAMGSWHGPEGTGEGS